MSNKKGSKGKDQLTQKQREKQQVKQMKKLDLTSLKEQIYNLRTQLQNLINHKLNAKKEIEVQNQLYMKETYDLQTTIKEQQEKIVDLENKFNILQQNYEAAITKCKNLWEEQMQALVNRKRKDKENIINDYNSIRKKVQFMKQFKIRQQQYIKTINALQEKMEQTKHTHVADIQKIQVSHSKNREEIADHAQKQVQGIKESQVNRLQAKMSKQQHIKRQNDLMIQQINLCQSEKKVLQQQCHDLLRQITNEKGNSYDNLLGGQAGQTYERSLRVIKLQGKLGKLRQYLKEEAERLDNEYNKMEAMYEQKQKQLEQNIGKSQTMLKLKQRDNKKLKACSQMVLNQRSHLQSYLLEVFHEHHQLDYKDERNINQILRLLFIKINSNKQPISYKHYLSTPQNSLVSHSTINQ